MYTVLKGNLAEVQFFTVRFGLDAVANSAAAVIPNWDGALSAEAGAYCTCESRPVLPVGVFCFFRNLPMKISYAGIRSDL